MVIYLARHGDASKPSLGQPSVLTAKGKSDIARTISALRGKNARFSRVWHSPKPRAAQTAAFYLESLGVPGSVPEEVKELSPGGDAQTVLEKIETEKIDSLLIVSHLPLLGHLAFLMLGNSEDRSPLPFPTSSVACLEEKPGQIWEWLWSADPSSK